MGVRPVDRPRKRAARHPRPVSHPIQEPLTIDDRLPQALEPDRRISARHAHRGRSHLSPDRPAAADDQPTFCHPDPSSRPVTPEHGPSQSRLNPLHGATLSRTARHA